MHPFAFSHMLSQTKLTVSSLVALGHRWVPMLQLREGLKYRLSDSFLDLKAPILFLLDNISCILLFEIWLWSSGTGCTWQNWVCSVEGCETHWCYVFIDYSVHDIVKSMGHQYDTFMSELFLSSIKLLWANLKPPTPAITGLNISTADPTQC